MTKKLPQQLAPQFGTSIGMAMDTRPNRNVSTNTVGAPPVVSIPKGEVDRQTEVFTYFTIAGVPAGKSTPILYNADRVWANITLTLETAGPVVVGTRADLAPVLSGKGELLITDVPLTFTIAKGDRRLYILSTSVNRVKVVIQPYAWIEQVAGGVDSILAAINNLNARR